jgi:hypothetical protein
MIVANYILHYGCDYLAYSVKSIYDHVDKIFVVYTDQPSHGHGTNLLNPETRADVMDALYVFGDPGNKIHVVDGRYAHEGQHRGVVGKHYGAADLILVVDADEIWHENTIGRIIEYCLKTTDVSCFKMPFIHFWRSFKYHLTDPCMPDRLYAPKRTASYGTYRCVPAEFGPVFHFGYAREERFIKYKIDIHGHKGEWRPEWFESKFKAWPMDRSMSDLHPTCHQNFWGVAKPFELENLPNVLKTHPYYTKDII